MATWNRQLEVSADHGHLFVSMMGPGTPSNPPNRPGKPIRTDTANDITVHASDRSGPGARIIYHGDGCTPTGIVAKTEGGPLPSFSASGGILTITDTGATGTEYSYYVTGTADPAFGGENLRTEDPQIHNVGDD